MLYLRSFNRFILISLALLGLSVSSANAVLTSGFDATFGVNSITIDSVSGLEWLDLTYTGGLSYDLVSGNLTGGTWDGWRHASGAEVGAFWTSGGAYGSAGSWVADVIDLWGFTSCSYYDPSTNACIDKDASFITSDVYIANQSHYYGQIWDSPSHYNNGASTIYDRQLDSSANYRIAHALVRDPNAVAVVPVPAAIWLFGTALIGLVGYGKRKSKVPV